MSDTESHSQCKSEQGNCQTKMSKGGKGSGKREGERIINENLAKAKMPTTSVSNPVSFGCAQMKRESYLYEVLLIPVVIDHKIPLLNTYQRIPLGQSAG